LSELRALGDVAGDYLAEGANLVQGVHRAVAGRTPAGPVHHAIAEGVYGALRGAGRAAGAATGVALEAAGVREPTSTGRGAAVVGALNGLLGDRLEEEGSELALAMGWYPPPPGDPAAATSRLAVFIHGLGESETAWRLGGRSPYGERLSSDLGHTPLYLRYNTGLPVAENGRRLSELLEEAVDAWPVAVEEIVLVGHSMGGLVGRHACRTAGEARARWVSSVTHVVCLGAPIGGAPLAKAVQGASAALARVAETEPFARFLDLRSEGIRDLCLTCEAPEHPGAGAHYACATITARADHPLGWAIGDLLVRQASASAGSAEARHFGGRHHFQLLNDREVYDALVTWLADPASREGASPHSCSSL
jgi:pimeloyl-ACP methyl ester carboxylesterase